MERVMRASGGSWDVNMRVTTLSSSLMSKGNSSYASYTLRTRSEFR